MPRLTLSQVGKRYEGTPPVEALRDISLEIGQGEYVAIQGPSGGGKSSLLNLLALLDEPSQGTYTIGDVTPGHLSGRRRAELRSSTFAFVFQGFHLLDRRRVSDSVELGLAYRAVPHRQRRELATAALEQVGLAHLAEQPANKLSGGERQRVAIARALACRAPVLVADEPTGNLDSRNGQAIVGYLHDLHQAGTTVILVTHAPEVAAAAARRVQLLDGAIVGATEPGDVSGEVPAAIVGTPSKVRTRDVLVDAWASVRSRMGRTIGLVVAVAVGVALGVATLGLSASARNQVADTFNAHENRQVTITREEPDPGTPRVVPSFGRDAADTRQALMDVAGVAAVALVTDRSGRDLQVSASRPAEQVTVFGTTGPLADALDMRIRWASGVTSGALDAGQVLLGENLADRLALGPLVGGPSVLLDGRSMRVAGIVTSSNRVPDALGAVLASDQDSAALGAATRTRAFVLTTPGAAAQVARQAPYVIDPARATTLAVDAPADPRTLRAEVESDVHTTLVVLTAVALLASVLGLANAMVMSILERRQELGLRRAIGARTVHICSLVLCESSIVGAVGGLVGLAAGLAGILAVTIARHWSPVFDLRLAPVAIVAGVAVGAVGGLFAAVRAARIRPSDALRL